MQKISDDLKELFRERKALLWICQRYDLKEGEEPHDYNMSSEEAYFKYRNDSNDTDSFIASFYWEAVWFEGAMSPLLKSIKSKSDSIAANLRRSPVILSSESDASAEVPSNEFLPMTVLPGLMDENAVPESKYGNLRPRLRERIAWQLSGRLLNFQDRVLVVIGYQEEDDLERLYEVLEDRPFSHLKVLFITPTEAPLPSSPVAPGVHCYFWQGEIIDFLNELKTIGFPGAEEVPKWSIRVGSKTVTLHATDVERISKRFKILTDDNFGSVNKFNMYSLHRFLSGNIEDWSAYALNAPVDRSYTTEKGKTLEDVVQEKLDTIQNTDSKSIVHTIKIPCQGGSGCTTLLRKIAFNFAKKGYPSLILRSTQVDVDPEDVIAFSIALNEAALAADINKIPPSIIVYDTEHNKGFGLRQTMKLLSVNGRRTLFLRGISLDEFQDFKEHYSLNVSKLKPLYAKATKKEVNRCDKSFGKLISDWDLPIQRQSEEDWNNYTNIQNWISQDSSTKLPSIFWVALRFFLTEGMSFSDAEKAKNALSQWIYKRIDKIQSVEMMKVLKYVAVLSSLRIVSPMWTVLRPVTHGNFSTDLLEDLKQLDDVIEWDINIVEELKDNVLRFLHPSFAEEYLRREGIEGQERKFDIIKPLLHSMSPGHKGDKWLLECITLNECSPKFEDKSTVEKWRIDTFDDMPEAIRDQSPTILHHWGRCMYLFCDLENPNSANLTLDERKGLYELSIYRLKKASELSLDWEKDEHPGHVFNTLGTAYARFADFLDNNEFDKSDVEKSWDAACSSFERSISLLPGDNAEALLAFGNRIMRRANKLDLNEITTAEYIKALSLFDEADEIITEHPDPEPTWRENLHRYRSQVITYLNSDSGRDYINSIKTSDNPGLGYYCEARLILDKDSDEYGLNKAIKLLSEADNANIDLGVRCTVFYLFCLSNHPTKKFDFEKLRKILKKLQMMDGYIERPIDIFRYAVLCYQIGAYKEGFETFRKLREIMRRRSGTFLRVRDFWRDSKNPEKPKQTVIKVTRRITEWRAEGYVDELNHSIPFQPRHFNPPPKTGEVVNCFIRFTANGPLAIPPGFEK